MENVFFGIAVASFILAAVCAIACVVVFVKLEVMDAIKFLRHRTAASGVGLVGVLAHKPKQHKAKAEDLDRDTAPNVSRKKGKHERGAAKHKKSDGNTLILTSEDADSATDSLASSNEADSATDYLGSKGSGSVDHSPKEAGSENSTDLLAEADSESQTDLLIGEDSENQTDLLVKEDSENPTDLLVEEDSENPTNLLVEEDSEGQTSLLDEEDSESPTSLLVEEDSEAPTGLLVAESSQGATQEASQEDESENPTELLSSIEPQERQTSCLVAPEEEEESTPARTEEETVFRFQIKQSQMVVHTEEVIE